MGNAELLWEGSGSFRKVDVILLGAGNGKLTYVHTLINKASLFISALHRISVSYSRFLVIKWNYSTLFFYILKGFLYRKLLQQIYHSRTIYLFEQFQDIFPQFACAGLVYVHNFVKDNIQGTCQPFLDAWRKWYCPKRIASSSFGLVDLDFLLLIHRLIPHCLKGIHRYFLRHLFRNLI